jgi:glycosyltransferase involved in cell wall biosynthesis
MHEVHMSYGGNSHHDDIARKWICQKILKQCDLIITVSNKIAGLYNDFNRKQNPPVMVIRNAPNYHNLTPARAGETIKLVHVGGAQRDRGIIDHIKLMELLDSRFTLDLYLVSPTQSMKDHLAELKAYVSENQLSERVRILPPIPPGELIESLNPYDIGIYYLNPKVNNHIYSLPNKFFEYLQSRIALVVTPIESMAELLQQYNAGLVADDFTLENFARQVNRVADNLEAYKQNTNKAAEEMNAEKDWQQLLDYLEKKLAE